MRKRFNTERICSSENYEFSQRYHKRILTTNHNKLTTNHNNKEVITMSSKVKITETYYTYVFGKKVQIKKTELSHYEGFNIYTE